MNNSAEKTITFWLKCTKDNMETSNAMVKAKRWSFAMFMCQQTIEALLKAVFIIKHGKRPEYIHKLPKLLELTGVKVPLLIDSEILKIDAHYIKARYQEDRFDPLIYNKKNAVQLLKDTQEVVKWFVKNLNLEI
jgi:HEPN domain-containing protein